MTSALSQSGRSKILTDRDNRQLVKTVKTNRNLTLIEITEKFNETLNFSVSSRTIQRVLHEEGYSGHAAKKKSFISEQNKKKDLVGVMQEKIGLINGKILSGVMNQDLNYSIMILEIGYGVKKINDIILNV